MHIHILCIFTYIHIHRSTYIHKFSEAYTYVHTYIHTSLHTYVHAYIHTYIYIYVSLSTYLYIYTYNIQCACYRIHIYIYICIYTTYSTQHITTGLQRSAEISHAQDDWLDSLMGRCMVSDKDIGVRVRFHRRLGGYALSARSSQCRVRKRGC